LPSKESKGVGSKRKRNPEKKLGGGREIYTSKGS